MADPAPPGPPASRFQVAAYRVARGAIVAFSTLYWRLGVDGAEHVPATGAFVLAPVHRSNIDTPIVAAVTRRKMRFLGKEGVWRYRWSAWLFDTLGGFPVRRGTADRAALRRCIEVVSGGEPLVMFPEGTRRSGPLVESLYDGAAYVACQAQVPLVPVGIGGSERAMPAGARALRPTRVHLVVGPPIHPPPLGPDGRVRRRHVAELTERLGGQLQLLFDQARIRAGA
ncbi:MAG: lysophospholipid acyltransferase family protein [Acidimicrobiales bacterium]